MSASSAPVDATSERHDRARTPTTPILEARALVRHFSSRRSVFGGPTRTVRAVDGVDLAVRAGETLGVVGESGCGKSTLGRLLLRLIEPTSGQVLFEGEDLGRLKPAALRAKRARMQMVFQDPFSSLNPTMTIGAMLAEPLRLHGWRGGIEQRVAALLDTVGLPAAYAGRYPHEFSGGQRQRVGIARALAAEPSLVVCDEAVSALDVSIQAQVVNLLCDLQARFGLAYVFIAHDLAVVRHIASRVVVMYLGQVVEIAARDALFAHPLHPYTRALLDAVPRPDPPAPGTRTVRAPLEGDPPDPAAPPPGCRFHNRCPHARERCVNEAPRLAPIGPLDDRRVACHFAAELFPPPPALVSTGGSRVMTNDGSAAGRAAGANSDPSLARRLLALQQAFTEKPAGRPRGAESID